MNRFIAALLLLVPSTVFGAAGQGISTWTAQSQAIADGDFFAITDISDTTGSDDGTSKKATGLQVKTYVIGSPSADNQILQATGVGTFAWTSTLEGIIDDTKGNGDTTYIWSADKVFDELALKQASDADLTTWAGITPGTGVGTMLAIAPGSAGGPTTTIASGTSALGTSEIASGACASAVTTTATNTATTDVINWGFNGDPTGVTGYNPSGNLLYIVAYPSANNVNFKVCNKSGSAITPGAITLNWRVQR